MLADCSYVSLGLVVSGEQEHEHRNMPENATRPTAAAPTIRILREFNDEAAIERREKKRFLEGNQGSFVDPCTSDLGYVLGHMCQGTQRRVGDSKKLARSER